MIYFTSPLCLEVGTIEIYWSFIAFGVIFAVVSLILGEIIGHWIDGIAHVFHLDHMDFLSPMVVVGGVTAFGAAGLFYNSYFGITGYILVIFAALTAITLSCVIYFLHVKRMKQTENSIAHSIKDLVGNIGVVSVPIPAAGLGEIIVKTGFGTYNYSANSFDNVEIKQGTRVVVVQVDGFNCSVSIIDF